jgi:hypothetical protein
MIPIPPFAGITLTRFYGYDLSPDAAVRTPRETLYVFEPLNFQRLKTKITEKNCSVYVTFIRSSSYHEKTIVMGRILFVFIIGLSSLATRAQKTVNDANAEKRTVSSFHGIEVSNGIELTLTQAGTEDVAVSASTPEWKEKIITKVENGILKIYYEHRDAIFKKDNERRGLKAYVSFISLDRLDANTGSRVEIVGTLSSTSLKMKVNTGAIVIGKVEVSDLDVDQNTGSIMTISGRATKLEVEGGTGSMFHGNDLESETCNARTNTGAGIYITVQKELEAKANTGGYVKYKGNGSVREARVNSGGLVKRI